MTRSTHIDRLVEDLDLIEVLRVARIEIGDEDGLAIPNAPDITFQLLYRSGHSWDLIEEIYGGRDEAKAGIESMIVSESELKERIETIGLDRNKAEGLFEASKTWLLAIRRGE